MTSAIPRLKWVHSEGRLPSPGWRGVLDRDHASTEHEYLLSGLCPECQGTKKV